MVSEPIAWVRMLLQEYPLIAPILFLAVHVALAILVLPCSPMTLMAGALWGGTYGLCLSIVGALASSAATFLLSRNLFRERIQAFLLRRYPSVSGILSGVVTHDWKLVAATQLNPLLPASVMGYVFGLTNIPLVRYVALSAIFMIPMQILYVYIGQAAVSTESVAGVSILFFLVFVLLIMLPMLSKFVKKKF